MVRSVGPARLPFFMFVLGLLLLIPPDRPSRAGDPPAPDTQALELADSLIAATGGKAGWEAARFFRFDFVVEKEGKELARYRHWWDRETGRYRLEGTNQEGKNFRIFFNVQSRRGKVWMDGEPADPDTTAKMLEYGYGRFINDSYWILMPFKMKDPGVNLAYQGAKKDPTGQTWEVVRLSFDAGIGLTPGDRYWAFLDPKTHLMGRWEYVLEDEKPPAEAWTWEGWKRFGPILLSPLKKKVGADVSIRFPNLAVSPSVDESAFREPA